MKYAAILSMLLLITGGTGSPAATSRPAQSAEGDGRASECPSWVEVPSGGEPFSVRFPVPPSHSMSRRPDGRRWDLYVAGQGDKIFSLRYRKKSSDEVKWSQLNFDDVELSHRRDRNILKQSACILDGYSAIEEVRKEVAGYYWRDLRIVTDGYLCSMSLGAKTAAEVESSEADCFFESFKLRSADATR